MPYTVEHSAIIKNTTEDWKFVFSTDEYGTVCVKSYNLNGMLDLEHTIFIPKDCIDYFTDVLNKLKCA